MGSPCITRISNLWGASRALAVLEAKGNKPLLVIAEDQKQADLLYNELTFFNTSSAEILLFPEYAHIPFERVRIRPEIAGLRSAALKAILKRDNYIIISTLYGILKKIAPPDIFDKAEIILAKGAEIPLERLAGELERIGYLPVEAVNEPGEFCVRGGIVDIFPINSSSPVRLDYFGKEIDGIFYYSLETQRQVSEIREIKIFAASEIIFTAAELLKASIPNSLAEDISYFGKVAGLHWLTHIFYESPSVLPDYIRGEYDLVVMKDDLEERLERFFIGLDPTLGFEGIDAMGAFASRKEFLNYINGRDYTLLSDTALLEGDAARYKSAISYFVFEKKNPYHNLTKAIDLIKKAQADGYITVAAFESERFISLLRDFCRDHELPLKEIDAVTQTERKTGGKPNKTVYLYPKRVGGGFLDERKRFLMVADTEIFGFTRKKSTRGAKRVCSTALADITAGEYVVHARYGIGVYRGLKHMVLGGVDGDYLEIGYDADETLYIPVQQIQEVQKYIGLGGKTPRLSSLHTSAWIKAKTSAKRAAAKIAQDLLILYAERKARKGFAFQNDPLLTEEFEQRFKYDETEDQLAAILDVYKDMRNSTPMDRLVCGDVGFGKTEVAMRAAFLAASSDVQTAVLVPTTVLARQHYLTFTERFKEFPVKIDFVSRFRTASEFRDICRRVSEGDIDILIGTHRLLSNDLVFKNLRLLIVDEEQRFGVAHKEKIQALKTNIDVLSLSATPIPRTLQMSLSGIRDMSVIETPPASRLPVVMKVIKREEEVGLAIRKELERGGQAFYLHNRISDIGIAAAIVKQYLPQAAVRVAHGQTHSRELDKILTEFYHGGIDVLVSTSIIENGIDIPNVNTIVIDDIHTFGLSQLYQLKGRVGRSDRRGYCYLYVKNFAELSPVAKKRLSIIQQLSELGSGLKIAMSDLELRGAGDILGAAQSGFAVKVGYELFISMIEAAVHGLSDEHESPCEIATQFPHYIAADYIEEPNIRLEYYNRFAAVSDRKALAELAGELAEQYGDLRPETVTLGNVMLIKNLAGKLGITNATLLKKTLKLTFSANADILPQTLITLAGARGFQIKFTKEYEASLSVDKEYPDFPDLIVGFLEKLAATK
ncbi:MAG: transcription-repair coupling factor [Deferribacteraceae bacterium]|jgi:transcription-repair coupling factor (superfamily II helicase)|nr:transcription-repair coupling factor [Deferribacteraceae bacterium]